MNRLVKLAFLTLFLSFIATPALSIQAVKQFEETSYYLKDVCFINIDVGWAVGEPHWDQTEKGYKGTIIKTADGGETWMAQEAGVAETLRGVTFVDANNGWAVGTNGTILHTNDGGSHWSRQSVATDDGFRGVAFIDANQGWATSFKPIHYRHRREEEPDNWEGSIWHTNNGGGIWSQQTIPDNASILNRIDFIDADNGWAVGTKYIGNDKYGLPQHAGTVYHTKDGGQTWLELYSPGTDIVLNGVDFVDANNGWVVGFPAYSSIKGGFTYHTSDGGKTWDRQEPGGAFDPLWDVQFIDQNRGYAVGFDYSAAWGPPVWRTLDGGDTWEKVIMEQRESDGLFGVSVIGNQVIAVGDHDFVAKSTEAWKSCDFDFPEDPVCYHCSCLFEQSYINVHYSFEDVFFVDENHGWAAGQRSYKPGLWGQVILYTHNGGSSWEIQYEQATPLGERIRVRYFRLNKVFFTDSQNGWAVGRSEIFHDDWQGHGAILHTTDGGLNWEEQRSDLLVKYRFIEFVSAQFLDTQNGWALVGYEPTISLAHTTDGGISWDWVDTGIEGLVCIGNADILGDLFFSDAQHGWVVGGHENVLHTDDGGISWVRQELPASCLEAVEFINNQEGWIVGRWDLYHTTDGGISWLQKDIEFDVKFQDIQFPNSVNGWLVGDSGCIMHTDDGGNTWEFIDTVTSATLRGLSFINSQKGWAVGDYGTIIAIGNKSAPSVVPSPDIRAMNLDGPVTINQGEKLTVTVSLDPGSYDGENADWWIAVSSSFGLYWFTLDSGWIISDIPVRTYGGPLFSFSPFSILEISILPVGNYTFYFAVDNDMDNILDATYLDFVSVTIQ